jgi:hypothetical protein
LCSSIGAADGQTGNFNMNVSIVIILPMFAMLLAEYARSLRTE